MGIMHSCKDILIIWLRQNVTFLLPEVYFYFFQSYIRSDNYKIIVIWEFKKTHEILEFQIKSQNC